MNDNNLAENDFDSLEAFHDELDSYLKEYNKLLNSKYARVTASKHYCVIRDFNEFVTMFEGCNDLGGITKAMTASKLAKHINSQGDDFYATVTVKNIIDTFLRFIYEKYRIRNPKLTL